MTATIGIIGGTGAQGKGLGYRFALAGNHVILGSRAADRAGEVASQIASALPDPQLLRGASNTEAVRLADIVLLAVPFAGMADIVSTLASDIGTKTVVCCVNPLGFDKDGPYGLSLPEGSAAELVARLLVDASVVAAFHHISANNLITTTDFSGEDILVCGDDTSSKESVIQLAASVAGKPGVDAGALRMARYLEPMTAVLISINKRYKIHAGLAITGHCRDISDESPR